MRAARTAALVASIGLLVLPGTTRAQWSAVRGIDSHSGQLAEPGIAFAADGTAAVGWVSGGDTEDPFVNWLAPRGTAFGSPRPAGHSGLFTSHYFALYGRGRIVVADRVFRPGAGNEVAVAFGRRGRRLGSFRRLAPGASDPPQVVANPGGDVAVIAEITSGPQPYPAVFLFYKRRGQRFGRAIQVSRPGGAGAYEVAINRHGDVLAAWQQDGYLWARFRTAGGRLGRLHQLSRARGYTQVSAAVGSRRRAIVVWASQLVDFSGSAPRASGSIRVRVRTALPGDHFRGAPLMDQSDDTTELTSCTGIPFGLVRAAIDATGAPLAAWTSRTAGHFVVRVAQGPALNRDVPPQTVSDPTSDGCLGDLVTDRDGSALAVWSQGPRFSGQRVRTAVRAGPDGPFGEIRDVGSGLIFSPRAAFDPRFLRALVVWHGGGDRVSYVSRHPIPRG